MSRRKMGWVCALAGGNASERCPGSQRITRAKFSHGPIGRPGLHRCAPTVRLSHGAAARFRRKPSRRETGEFRESANQDASARRPGRQQLGQSCGLADRPSSVRHPAALPPARFFSRNSSTTALQPVVEIFPVSARAVSLHLISKTNTSDYDVCAVYTIFFKCCYIKVFCFLANSA